MSSCWSTGDLLLLGDGVEQQLGLERLAGLVLDLGAVLVVLEAVLALRGGGAPRRRRCPRAPGRRRSRAGARAACSRACDALLDALGAARPASRRSSRSSSRVSNSLASWAKSSSRAGSSRSLTDCTVTVTSASWPGAVAAGQRGGERRRLAGAAGRRGPRRCPRAWCRSRPRRRRRVTRVDLLAVDLGAEVDRDEVAVLRRRARRRSRVPKRSRRRLEPLVDVVVRRPRRRRR